MSVVLAALDTTDVARAVLATATRFGLLTRADVEAVFVRDDPPGPGTSPEWLATGADVPFHLLDGPVESTLLEALGPAEVIGAVIGARATPRATGKCKCCPTAPAATPTTTTCTCASTQSPGTR